MATVEIGQELPRFDVTCYAGRPLEITLALLDGDGDPLSALAVVDARAHVRQEIDSPTVLHAFVLGDGIEASDGQLVLTATAADTTGWGDLWPGARPGLTVAWWDVEFTDDQGESWQLTAPGTMTVIHQVTR